MWQRFREKANLLEHMTCHTKRYCDCTYPCVAISTPPEEIRGLTLTAEPETNQIQYDQETHKCDDSEEQSKKVQNDNFVFSYECNICDKGFTQKNNLSIHKRSHSLINSTKTSATCIKCKKSFQNQQQLVYHTNKEHVTQLTFPCLSCENSFETKEAQQKHTKIHHNSKPTESKRVQFQNCIAALGVGMFFKLRNC